MDVRIYLTEQKWQETRVKTSPNCTGTLDGKSFEDDQTYPLITEPGSQS